MHCKLASFICLRRNSIKVFPIGCVDTLADLERCHAKATCDQFVVEELVVGRVVPEADVLRGRGRQALEWLIAVLGPAGCTPGAVGSYLPQCID